MSNFKFAIFFMVLLFPASQFCFPITIASVTEVQASSALASAEGAVVSAYQVVMRAEEAGANVSALLSQLNDAGEFLAKAKIAYKLEDFDETVRSTGLCSEIAGSVKKNGAELNDAANGSRIMGFWMTLTGSLLGTGVVIFGSFQGWRFFKRHYYKRLNKARG